MRKIIEAFEINEAKKISGYSMFTNMDKSALSEYSGFIKDVESFAKGMIPHMSDPNSDSSDSIEMVLELDNVVNSTVGTTITFYGWNKFSEDEIEFERVWNKDSMEKYIKGLLNGKMKNFHSIFASTYWTARRSFGNKRKKTVEVGPYVEITYDNDKIRD